MLFNTPPADAEDESLRTAPKDWRRRRNTRRPSISSISPGSPSISARPGRASSSTPRICRSIGGAALAEHEEKALELFHNVEEVKREAARFLKVKAVWQFFEAERDGNSIHLFAPAGVAPIHTFHFGRQRREDGLCLSDYILEGNGGRRDHLALMVVTAGAGIREKSEEFKQAGAFFKAHAIQALAIETAEATAEWLHRRIREDWGFPDAPTVTMHDRFTSKYHGKRYSFGYPACPNLDDQQGVWKLLQPEDIGVELTEGMMMEPEASVSAIVFHHLDCAYFTADEGESGAVA
jgi:5-methyltetrahydrofolate--homocysteine methyltransferase